VWFKNRRAKWRKQKREDQERLRRLQEPNNLEESSRLVPISSTDSNFNGTAGKDDENSRIPSILFSRFTPTPGRDSFAPDSGAPNNNNANQESMR